MSIDIKGVTGVGSAIVGGLAGAKSITLAAVNTWQEQVSWLVTLLVAIGGGVVSAYMAAKLKAERDAIKHKQATDDKLGELQALKLKQEADLAGLKVIEKQRKDANDRHDRRERFDGDE